MTNSDQFAEPPPRGWTLAEALSRLPEEELRDRLAPRKLRLRGFKWKGHSWAEGLEAVSTEADPLWAATAIFSLELDMIYGDGLRLFKCRFLSGEVAAAVGASIPVRQASSKGSNKPLTALTTIATQALAAVLYREGIGPQPTASRLAKRACELAEELDLPGWDVLSPRGSSLRSLAQAVIDGVRAEDAKLEKR